MYFKRVVAPVVGLAIGFLSIGSSANAATTITSTFQAKIAIGASCIFSTGAASDIDFGFQTALTAVINQTSTIQVQCTTGTPYTVGLNGGSVANNVAARQMKSAAGGLVNYALFQDTNHLVNWTDTGGGLVSGTGTGSPITHTVFGHVPVQTTPAVGSYADTITVSVTY